MTILYDNLSLRSVAQLFLIKKNSSLKGKMKMIDLSVDIAGIRLNNPIMPASGTFDVESFMDISGFKTRELGAVVSKGTSSRKKDGNKQPRSVEVFGGMINSIGLQNLGVDGFIKKKLFYLIKSGVPVFVNVCGCSIEEYVEVVKALEVAVEADIILGYEINISCPNLKPGEGGQAFGQDPIKAAGVLRAVRPLTKRILIAKLTPNVTSTVPIARAVIEAGANAISAVNTFRARKKIWSSPDRGKYVQGGQSGPGIMAMALMHVWDLSQANLGVPIIGMGGIHSVLDVVEFFENGAVAVQVGTANFTDPLIMMKLTPDLALYIEKAGCQSLKEWREKSFPMPPEKDFPHFQS